MIELIPAVLGIVVIDLALAGDNAVVIGMAAYRLPRHQRNIAVALGAIGAMVLRISLTAAAALILGLPLLQFIGGLILIWIAYKLLRPVEVTHAGDGHVVEAASSLWEAVQTIIIADIVMSLDNVLAIAGASKGNIPILVFGLILSIAILMAGGRLVASILDRFPGFVYLGSGILAWVAGGMLVHDSFAHEYWLRFLPAADWVVPAVVTGAVLAAGLFRLRPDDLKWLRARFRRSS